VCDFDQDGVLDLLMTAGDPTGTFGVIRAHSLRDGHEVGVLYPERPGTSFAVDFVTGAPQPMHPFPTVVVWDPEFNSSSWQVGQVGLIRTAPSNVRPLGPGCTSIPASLPRIGYGVEGQGTRVHLSGATPDALATLLIGLSSTSFGGVPLPMPLDALGFAGCSLQTSIEASATTCTAVGLDRGCASFIVPRLPVALHGQWAVLDRRSAHCRCQAGCAGEQVNATCSADAPPAARRPSARSAALELGRRIEERSRAMPPKPKRAPAITRELIAALPKSDLHVHLDGSLRLQTLIELARERAVELPSTSEDGLLRTVFKRAYRNLPEYLKGFEFTVACLQDAEALERTTYELCLDCRAENVLYTEIRFAPQLHAHGDFDVVAVLRAVAKGIERAKREINRSPEVAGGRMPAFEAGIVVCAMRFFLPAFSAHYRAYFDALPNAPRRAIYGLASLELARATVRAVEEEGLPVVGVDLAGQERGFPAKDHVAAYQHAHDHFLGKTVHAGEDYGPESIFQAITDCHADRIGHGTWLFSTGRIQDQTITDRKRYVQSLVRYVADRRITLEVCLTSNQQTIPEFRGDLAKHPFRDMRRARLSVTLCTDNRLVSRTTVTDEVWKAVETFKLTPRELKDVLIYGFKRSFFPGSYPGKRDYVRAVLNRMEAIMATHGIVLRPGEAD